MSIEKESPAGEQQDCRHILISSFFRMIGYYIRRDAMRFQRRRAIPFSHLLSGGRGEIPQAGDEREYGVALGETKGFPTYRLTVQIILAFPSHTLYNKNQ
jgi:hypothetical protein